MAIIADTHVHLYPAVHGVDTLCATLARNLGRLAADAGQPAAVRVACLVEREGQQELRDLGAKAGARTVSTADGVVHLIAGRQFATAERIEVLGLAVELEAPDGAPAATYVDQILAAGGVPVLAWAPGKWLFTRGKLVRALIQRYGAQLVLGDSSLRPIGWGEPRLMQAGRRAGLRVIAGSDPLPVPGDERHAGTYATLFAAAFDPAQPVASMRAALQPHGAAVRLREARIVGRRCGPLTVVGRIRAMKG